jgi:hypothetical protein
MLDERTEPPSEDVAGVIGEERGRAKRRGRWFNADPLASARQRRERRERLEAMAAVGDVRGLATALRAFGVKESDELYRYLLSIASSVVKARGRKP